MMAKKCSRCGLPIPAGEDETCWYCYEPLCLTCWETWGHCGHHVEVDLRNAKVTINRLRELIARFVLIFNVRVVEVASGNDAIEIDIPGNRPTNRVIGGEPGYVVLADMLGVHDEL